MIINLKRRIPIWQENGIITEDVATKLIEFEESRDNKNWVSYGIAGIGITALLTGVISIIAANWDELSDSIKLIGYFGLQLFSGILFLKAEKNKNLWREIALIVFALLFWAGIALIGQVYNLSGTWWEAMTFWLILTLPATFYAKSRILPNIWSLVALSTAFTWVAESKWPTNENVRICIASSAPLVLILISFITQRLELIDKNFKTALNFFGFAALLIYATPVADIMFNQQHYRGFEQSEKIYLLIPWAAGILAVISSMSRNNVKFGLKLLTSILIISSMTFVTIPNVVKVYEIFTPTLCQIIGAVSFIMIWSLAAAVATLASYRRLYDFASCVIAIRFIVIYFQVFGNLSTTGLGLIISGIVIISIAIAWNKLRHFFLIALKEHR